MHSFVVAILFNYVVTVKQDDELLLIPLSLPLAHVLYHSHNPPSHDHTHYFIKQKAIMPNNDMIHYMHRNGERLKLNILRVLITAESQEMENSVRCVLHSVRPMASYTFAGLPSRN